MAAPIPDWYNDLDGSLVEAWRQISRGVSDRKSGFHTMAVATNGLNGAPQLRTVVLRAVSVAERSLTFHTDRRAGKVAELEADPRIALHFYVVQAKLQLRLAGKATLHRDDDIMEVAWAATRPFSRECYRVTPDSAAPIGNPDEAEFELDDEGARQNFCAVRVVVDELEWLYLHSVGHRRARYTWSSTGDYLSTWLVP